MTIWGSWDNVTPSRGEQIRGPAGGVDVGGKLGRGEGEEVGVGTVVEVIVSVRVGVRDPTETGEAHPGLAARRRMPAISRSLDGRGGKFIPSHSQRWKNGKRLG